MDVLVCLSVTAVELMAADMFHLHTLSPRLSPSYGLAAAIFLAHYLVLKIYRIFLYPHFFSPLRHLPGPKKGGHFLLGQSLNIQRSETPTSIYTDWMKQHPDAHFIRYLGFLNKEYLVPNSVVAQKAALQTNCYSFTKPEWLHRFAQEIGAHGLLFMEGAEHRAHRKMLTNSFSLKSIRKLEPVFVAKSKDICGVLHQAIARNDGKSGVFNCCDIFMKAILDIVGPVLLGIDLDYVKPGDDFDDFRDADEEKSDLLQRGCTFHQAYAEFFSPKGMGKFLLHANAFVPVRWLPLKANRDFKFGMNWLHATLMKLIRDRYREVAEAKEAGTFDEAAAPDLLTLIAAESGPGGPTEGLTETDLRDHLLQLLAAGHDTTANMLSWSSYILASRHDIQETLRQELQTLPPDAPFSDLERLPYLDGFVKETLRLYPPGAKMNRKACEDVNVEGILLPKGTELDFAPAVITSNPVIWGEDVDVPDPTRWSRLKGVQSSPYAFTTFSNGPRVCLGKHFALVEVKILLAEIVRNFRFTDIVNPGKVESPAITLRPAGLEVRIEAV